MNKRQIIKWILRVIISIIIIGTAFVLGISYIIASGCGFDDQFSATIIESSILETENILQTKKGEIRILNRADIAPLVQYIPKNREPITFDLSLEKNIDGKIYSQTFNEIYNIQISKESWRYLYLNFTADWAYGHERGSFKINKKNGSNRLCLSW